MSTRRSDFILSNTLIMIVLLYILVLWQAFIHQSRSLSTIDLKIFWFHVGIYVYAWLHSGKQFQLEEAFANLQVDVWLISPHISYIVRKLKRWLCRITVSSLTLDARRCAVGQAPFNVCCFHAFSIKKEDNHSPCFFIWNIL